MNKINACGVPRSGSTLVWQILRSILGSRVIKSHPGSWKPEEGYFIVGSIRHPYDIAGSRFRSRIVGDKGDGSQETVVGTLKGLRQELVGMKTNFDILRDLMGRYPHVILRYEEFFNNFDVIFDMIQDQFGIAVPLPLRRSLKQKHSFEANRGRSFNHNPKEWSEYRINRSHTAVGVPGAWKAIIPQWGYPAMKRFCDPLCKEWGYENQ